MRSGSTHNAGSPGVPLVVCLGISVLATATGFAGPGAHPACDSCHATTAERSAGTELVGGDVGCRRCHAGQRRTSRGNLRPASIEQIQPGHPTTCVTCHDPHAQSPALLREPETRLVADGVLDPTSRLCVGCHEKQGQWRGWSSRYRRHPVGIPVTGQRPAVGPELVLPLVDIRNTRDPSDDVIACITCHDVHAATGEHLLRWWKREVIAACTACHPVNGEPRGAELLAWIRRQAR